MSDVTDTPAGAADTAPSTARQGSFVWYELMTPDPAAAKRFYDAVVGWNIEPRPSGDLDYRMIRRSDGGNAGGVLELSDEMRANGARPIWLGYIGVSDVDAAVAALEADGATVTVPPRNVAEGLRIAMVSDPTGVPLYVMHTTSEGTSDAFSVDQPQHVRWNELWSSDPERSVEFYKRHFGWAQDGDMDMGEMGKYRFVQHDGVTIGAIMPKMPDVPRPMWNFYIGVDDIDRAAEAVKSGGGEIFQEPMQIPGGQYALNGTDPQGAMFGLVGPRH